jgi:hypothetical protein
MKTCETCRFWRRNDVDAQFPNWGECRRRSPNQSRLKGWTGGEWPSTEKGNWCGDFAIDAEKLPEEQTVSVPMGWVL